MDQIAGDALKAVKTYAAALMAMTGPLTEAALLTAADIRAVREKAGVSQAVLAEYIGVTTGRVPKWECGDKRPSRMALKLLAVVKKGRLDAVA